MSMKKLYSYGMTALWISTAMGNPAVIISKLTELPRKVENNKIYPVSYRLSLNPAIARYVKKITILPVSSGGALSLGGGELFKDTTSTCQFINSASPACLWNGQFRAIVTGGHQVHIDYMFGGITFQGTRQSQESTTSIPTPFTVTIDSSFNEPAVKRLKVKNTGTIEINDLSVDDSTLGIYFLRYNGSNGSTPRGPWCTPSSCSNRCGALSGELNKGQSCYIYLRATDKARLGTTQKKSLQITGEGITRTITVINTQVLYAVGNFTNAKGNNYVSQYDGRTWISLGDGPTNSRFNGTIIGLNIGAMGQIYVTGNFTNGNGSRYAARYDGNAWTTLGISSSNSSFNAYIYPATIDSSGKLYLGGYFTNATGNQYVARYDPGDKSWTNIGDGTSSEKFNDYIYALAIDQRTNPRLYVGGRFTNSASEHFVAQYNNGTWGNIGTGPGGNPFDSTIFTFSLDKAGNLYVGGAFDNSSGKQYMAKYNGISWTSIGDGPDAAKFNARIYISTIDGADNLYVGGGFSNGDGNRYIAKYNITRSSWSSISDGPAGSKFNGDIYALTTDTTGKLYVGGFFKVAANKFYVARYDGNAWSRLGGTPFNNAIRGLKISNLISFDLP